VVFIVIGTLSTISKLIRLVDHLVSTTVVNSITVIVTDDLSQFCPVKPVGVSWNPKETPDKLQEVQAFILCCMLFWHNILVAVESGLAIIALILTYFLFLNLTICWLLGFFIILFNDISWLFVCWSLLEDKNWLSVCWLLLDHNWLIIGVLAVGKSSIVASVKLLVALVSVTLVVALVIHNIYYNYKHI
jgi:hypothetical protein